MKFEILKKYIEECKGNKVVPTWEGLHEKAAALKAEKVA